jgi:hydroxymethylpyrimidine/phosphomethylpyrimidine kinase
MNTPPVVLCFGGFDPTNGAGLQADTLTIHALGCHPLSVVTANTIQDSIKVHEFLVTDPAVVRRQAAALLADTAIAACKTGMLASPAVVETVAELVGLLPSAVPLVVDPVLAAGGGASLAENGLVRALREWLLPRATVVTPNIPELLALAGLPDDMDQAARSLLAGGRASVLVTGTHDIATSDVVHRLYRPDGTVTASRWARPQRISPEATRWPLLWMQRWITPGTVFVTPTRSVAGRPFPIGATADDHPRPVRDH